MACHFIPYFCTFDFATSCSLNFIFRLLLVPDKILRMARTERLHWITRPSPQRSEKSGSSCWLRNRRLQYESAVPDSRRMRRSNTYCSSRVTDVPSPPIQITVGVACPSSSHGCADRKHWLRNASMIFLFFFPSLFTSGCISLIIQRR